jgi:hypothetical protein
MGECLDETTDELATARLALRNVVKLSRMPDYSVDKARPRPGPEAGRDATAVQRLAERRAVE